MQRLSREKTLKTNLVLGNANKIYYKRTVISRGN